MASRLFVHDGSAYADLTTYLRLPPEKALEVTERAEEASPGTSTFELDDPLGELNLLGLRPAYIDEDSAEAPYRRTWTGYLAGRTISRGDVYRVGVSRVWSVEVVDLNSYVSRRLLTNTVDASRPAETDIARLSWLLSTWQVVAIGNETLIDPTGPVSMDAVDYRGMPADAVLGDLRTASGKDAFLYWDEAGGTFGIWYAHDDYAAYTATLSLSNVFGVWDRVSCFPISLDTSLSMDPSRTISGARVEYEGGVWFERDADQAAAIGGARELPFSEPFVKTAAKAEARALRLLADHATEEHIVTTTVPDVPEALVNRIKCGQRVLFQASHLPGCEEFSYRRVKQRSVKQASESSYDINLVLAVGGGAYPPAGQSCPGGAYGITPSQHFTPTGNNPSPSPGYFFYASGSPPSTLQPGVSPTWGFPEYNGPGGSDFAGDCTLSALYFLLIGPGTLTVETAAHSGTRGMSYQVFHDEGAGMIAYGSSVPVTPGDTVVVVLGQHDDDVNCMHAVVFGDGSGGCGGKWGWTGADWVLGEPPAEPPSVPPAIPSGGGGGGTGGTLVAATPGALAAAVAAASDGDTLTLRGGTHLLAGIITTSKSLRFQNYTGETPIITWGASTRNDGLYFTGGVATISGITFQASAAITHDANGSAQVELDGGDGLVLIGCTFIGHANYDDHQQLVYQRLGRNIIVQECTFLANGSEGFGFHQYPGTSVDPNCLVTDCSFDGFQVSGGVTSDSRIRVEGSVFTNNNIGVQLRNDADGSVIQGNSGSPNDDPLDIGGGVSGVTDIGNTWS